MTKIELTEPAHSNDSNCHPRSQQQFEGVKSNCNIKKPLYIPQKQKRSTNEEDISDGSRSGRNDDGAKCVCRMWVPPFSAIRMHRRATVHLYKRLLHLDLAKLPVNYFRMGFP